MRSIDAPNKRPGAVKGGIAIMADDIGEGQGLLLHRGFLEL